MTDPNILNCEKWGYPRRQADTPCLLDALDYARRCDSIYFFEHLENALFEGRNFDDVIEEYANNNAREIEEFLNER